MKKLSVIVPCYNLGGVFLSRCVDSLVHQDIDADSYEVLLIDDGSTDDTGAICDRYAAKFPQVKAIHQANSGPGGARNTGLDQAQGKYLWFVDGDDFVAQNCFKHLLEIAEENTLDLLAFDFVVIEEGGEAPSDACNKKCEVRVSTGVEYLSANGWYANTWWYIVERSFVEQRRARFSEGRILEDISFTLELLLSAQRMAKTVRQSYFYVQRPQSIMHNRDAEHLRKFVADCLFCYHLMDRVISEHRGQIDERLYPRLATRRDVHLYLGLGEALKLGEAKAFYRKLKTDGLLPLKRIDQREFTGLKWKVARMVFNSPLLTCALSKLYVMFKHK